jgi:hypothetical protein
MWSFENERRKKMEKELWEVGVNTIIMKEETNIWKPLENNIQEIISAIQSDF